MKKRGIVAVSPKFLPSVWSLWTEKLLWVQWLCEVVSALCVNVVRFGCCVTRDIKKMTSKTTVTVSVFVSLGNIFSIPSALLSVEGQRSKPQRTTHERHKNEKPNDMKKTNVLTCQHCERAKAQLSPIDKAALVQEAKCLHRFDQNSPQNNTICS